VVHFFVHFFSVDSIGNVNVKIKSHYVTLWVPI
jgi:hypothetical protein